MSVIKNIISKVPILEKAAFYLRNQVKRGGNRCDVTNLHSAGCRIRLTGTGQRLDCSKSAWMRETRIQMEGTGNSVTISGGTSMAGGGINNIMIFGNNNRVIVGKNCVLNKVSFFIRGSGNTIMVGDGCSAYNVRFHVEQDGNQIITGNGTTFHGRDEQAIGLIVDEGTGIKIGEDCMFAHSTQIRTTDSHSIVDMDGRRLNPARDIVIGDHCWVGLQCIILKGTQIPPHTVVAAGAVCSKKYDSSNCILAGNPARAVKQNVDWDRKFV